MTTSFANKCSSLNQRLTASSMLKSIEQSRPTCSNFKSSSKAAMTLMCTVASMPDSWMAKRRPRKTPRLRTLVAVTGTGTLSDVTAKTETDMVIGLMRGAVKTIARTIAIHHTKIKRT